MTPRGRLLVCAAALTTLAVGIAGYLFQPWLLVIDEQVSEALPVVSTFSPSAETTTGPGTTTGPETAAPTTTTAPETTAPGTTAPETTAPTTDVAGPAAEPAADLVELARGDLVSHEHTTTGTVRLLQLPDGNRVLRLEGLDTSNGPDLRVWLSDAPVLEGRDGWFVFDDGAFVDLGELRGNQGDANYPVPADVDLSALSSVSIWCARFSVSFGAAQLT